MRVRRTRRQHSTSLTRHHSGTKHTLINIHLLSSLYLNVFGTDVIPMYCMSTQSSKPGDTSAGLLHNYLSLLSQLNSTKATTRRRGASPPELHLRNKHYDHAELGYKYKASVKTLEIPPLSAPLTQQRCNWICSLLLSSRTRVTVQQHDTGGRTCEGSRCVAACDGGDGGTGPRSE